VLPQAKAVTIGELGFTGPECAHNGSSDMEPFSPFQSIYLQSTVHVCTVFCVHTPTGSLPITYSFEDYNYVHLLPSTMSISDPDSPPYLYSTTIKKILESLYLRFVGGGL
jgi:hypothetical protein